MKVAKILGRFGLVVAVALGTTACPPGPPETDGGTDAGTGFTQPAGTTALNFTIDASQRPAGFYANEELQWKGNFSYDKDTRIMTIGTGWAGPWAGLWDDGPWTTGGHEPKGSVAGDRKFGITVFVTTPTTDTSFGYGLVDSRGWIWQGGDGSVTIPANQTAEVNVPGQTLLPGGDVDLRLFLNTTQLPTLPDGGVPFVKTPTISVKGQMSGWGEDPAFDDGTHGDATAGDNIFTYTLSQNPIKELKLLSGTQNEFIWVFHPVQTDGGISSLDYKVGGGGALEGVSAQTAKDGGAWVNATVQQRSGPGNTFIDVP